MYNILKLLRGTDDLEANYSYVLDKDEEGNTILFGTKDPDVLENKIEELAKTEGLDRLRVVKRCYIEPIYTYNELLGNDADSSSR